jgi:hypothetical protein
MDRSQSIDDILIHWEGFATAMGRIVDLDVCVLAVAQKVLAAGIDWRALVRAGAAGCAPGGDLGREFGDVVVDYLGFIIQFYAARTNTVSNRKEDHWSYVKLA